MQFNLLALVDKFYIYTSVAQKHGTGTFLEHHKIRMNCALDVSDTLNVLDSSSGFEIPIILDDYSKA